MSVTPLTGLDAALLAAETPSQHLHVVATIVIDGMEATEAGSRFQVFQDRIAERHRMIEPLRRRLQVMPLGAPVWVDDPDLHLPSHLRHAHLDGGGLDAVARLAGTIASAALPRDRPLWEVWLVEGFEAGKVAVIAKVHHAAVDGVSGFDALAAFFDLEAHPATSIWADDWQPQPPPAPAEVLRHAVASGVRRPAGVLRAASQLAGAIGRAVPALGAGPLPLSAPRLSFNGSLRPSRSVALTSMPLDDVKTVRRAFGVTVNDVVLAVCAGALRRHLIAHDELPDRPIVAGVPVSERLPEHGSCGNRFSAMLSALPVHLDDPATRIEQVAVASTAAKQVHAASGVGALAAVADLVGARAVGPIMRAVSALRIGDLIPPVANVIVSNIRGPEFPLFVGGGRVEQLFPMGPLVEGTGLGMTVVSYRDQLGVGLLACPELLPELDALAAAMVDELDLLVEVAGVAS